MRHTFATGALEGNEEKSITPPRFWPCGTEWAWMGHASVEETEGNLHRDRARHAGVGEPPRRLYSSVRRVSE